MLLLLGGFTRALLGEETKEVGHGRPEEVEGVGGGQVVGWWEGTRSSSLGQTSGLKMMMLEALIAKPGLTHH